MLGSHRLDPRLYERVYAGAHANADSSRISRALFDWALRVGLRRNARRRSGLPAEPWAEAAYRVADRLVLHRIRDVLGERGHVNTTSYNRVVLLTGEVRDVQLGSMHRLRTRRPARGCLRRPPCRRRLPRRVRGR